MLEPGRENAKYRVFLSQPSVDAALAELACGQGAVLSHRSAAKRASEE
jgi:hypothetical protein